MDDVLVSQDSVIHDLAETVLTALAQQWSNPFHSAYKSSNRHLCTTTSECLFVMIFMGKRLYSVSLFKNALSLYSSKSAIEYQMG